MQSDVQRIAGDEVSNEIIRNCLLTRTRQISRVLTALYDQEMRPYGVNSPQFSMLALILEFGPISRSDLGRRNHQERSTLTRNLQSLIEQGLVSEEVPADGGRRRPLSLTAKGRGLLHAAAAAWSAAQAKAKALVGEAGAQSIMGIAGDLPRRAS